MPLDKKALKARLLKRYSEQLDEILEQVDGDKRLHLTEIEDMALQARQDVGQSITEELAINESQKREVAVACPECRKLMRYKGTKRKWIKTRTGDVQVDRPYYYCEHCKTGHFPPRLGR